METCVTYHLSTLMFIKSFTVMYGREFSPTRYKAVTVLLSTVRCQLANTTSLTPPFTILRACRCRYPLSPPYPVSELEHGLT